MSSFHVQLADDAVRDLEEICDYIDRHDSPARGDYLLERIERAFQGPSEHPQRGSHPRSCWTSGFRLLQALASSRVVENTVYVLVIADGRRDMQTLLQRRLLQA